MTPTQLAALKSEIQSDPAKLSYAPYIGVSDVQIAALLNATSGPGAASIDLATISKGSLLLQIVPWLDQLATGQTTGGVAIPPATVTKWQQRFQALQAGDAVLSVPALAAMMNDGVTDGLATAAQVAAITTRTGSRAEVLFGQGTVIQCQDVLAALGS